MPIFHKQFILISLIFTLTGGANLAHGQVATQEFTGGIPRFMNSRTLGVSVPTFIPDNPAAMQWVSNSTIGAGFSTGNSESNVTGKSENFQGATGGLSWVKDTLGIGVETMAHQLSYAGTEYSERLNGLAISTQPLKWMAFGVGLELSKQTVNGQENFIESSIYGLSFKMGSAFYLGLGMSKDSYENKTFLQEGKGNGQMFGMALMGGKSTQWHAEYSLVRKDDFVSIAGVSYFGGYTRSLFEVEMVSGAFLLGLAGFNLDYPGPNQTTSGSSLDIGTWRKDGLKLLLRVEQNVTSAGTTKIDEQVISLHIAQAFGKKK